MARRKRRTSYRGRKHRGRKGSGLESRIIEIVGILIGAVLVYRFFGEFSFSFSSLAFDFDVKSFFLLAASLLALYYLVFLVYRTRKKIRRDQYFYRQQNLEHLKKMPWREFEHYIGWLYERDGYHSEVTPGEKDGGVDVILTKGEERICVQAKKYEDEYISVKVVRELKGCCDDFKCTEAWFVTTSFYSNDAREFAIRNNIKLIDGNDLAVQIADFNVG